MSASTCEKSGWAVAATRGFSSRPRRGCPRPPGGPGWRNLGCEVEHQTAPQRAETDQAARLNEEARVGADRGGPGFLVTRVLHRPYDLEAPILGVGALIAQALEGDPHLHLV